MPTDNPAVLKRMSTSNAALIISDIGWIFANQKHWHPAIPNAVERHQVAGLFSSVDSNPRQGLSIVTIQDDS